MPRLRFSKSVEKSPYIEPLPSALMVPAMRWWVEPVVSLVASAEVLKVHWLLRWCSRSALTVFCSTLLRFQSAPV